ncbi:MAG: biotin--[acetyl-CoA-carboxylase] ligase [Planctomycetaceae bacterium]
MDFDLARIERETFLSAIEFHDEIGSTNDRALKVCDDSSIIAPRLILAERQTAGRGRGVHRWWSHSGALTLSLVLDAADIPMPFENWPMISLFAGLAVTETLAELASDESIRVKWPNDVYLGEKKICGILCEIPPSRPPRLVLGIGLNVNNSLRDAPPELLRTATSLTDETGLEHDRTEILIRLLQHFERQLQSFRSESSAPFLHLWSKRCLLTGRQVTHSSGDKRLLTGNCLGIDAQGALLLETTQGIERLLGGTIVDWT